MIDVAINGRGPFRFIVDTGAEQSVLSQSVARSLQLPFARTVKVEGVARAYQTSMVNVGTLSFGTISRQGMVLPVLPDSWLGADGYIGLDILDRHRVVMDFADDRLLVLHPSVNDGAPHADNLIVPEIYNSGRRGRLRTSSCMVDKVNTTIFIDTGASVTVGNNALFDALRDADADFHYYRNYTNLEDVAGGDEAGALLDFAKLSIADITLDNGGIIVAPLSVFEKWKLADTPALILGMDFLRRFDKVLIDYAYGSSFRFAFEGLRPYVA